MNIVLGMDIVEVMWLCYDFGIYTHEIAMDMITNPDIYQYIPIEGAHLEDACADVYDELSTIK